MLLIRPVLDANRERKLKTHMRRLLHSHRLEHRRAADAAQNPPLYLGYLNGVPFFFTLRLFPAWVIAQTLLLTMFFVWDRRMYARESADDLRLDALDQTVLKMDGTVNVGLALAIVAIAAAGTPAPWRELYSGWSSRRPLVVTPARASAGPARSSTDRCARWRCCSSASFITMVPAGSSAAPSCANCRWGRPPACSSSAALSGVLDAPDVPDTSPISPPSVRASAATWDCWRLTPTLSPRSASARSSWAPTPASATAEPAG